MLHSGNLPLSQVAKRLIEIDSLDVPNLKDRIHRPILKQQIFHRGSHLQSILSDVDYSLYSSLECDKFRIDCKRDEDRWVMTQSKGIIEVIHIVSLTDGTIFIYGQYLNQLNDFFKLPLLSSHLLIFSCKDLLDKTPPVLITIEEIKCKMFKMTSPRRFDNDESDSDEDEILLSETVFLPLLNTL